VYKFSPKTYPLAKVHSMQTDRQTDDRRQLVPTVP